MLMPGDMTQRKDLRDAAFMNVLQARLGDAVSVFGVPVVVTFGFVTAKVREGLGLVKSHVVDARCVSGHGGVAPCGEVFLVRKVRCHNRQLFKFNPRKGGRFVQAPPLSRP